MTDNKYAALIYYQGFGVKDDSDVYVKGILDAIGTLPPQERSVLETYYRHGKSCRQIGEDFGIPGQSVGKIVQKALRKLRHPSKAREMSIAQIRKDRDRYKEELAEARNRDLDKPMAPFSREMSICGMEFSARTQNALLRAGKDTVKSLLEIATFAELQKIRNLGAASGNEVIAKMRGLGFHAWADGIAAGQKG